uniref:Retrotransposon gag domain-containing protein n=1 Tax=Nicotiana tabacum TaxID=4097 RepID=A0A1S4ADQ4_TOBAC|nr:PREDICTED: uncharacterized protein LOC107796539 [Nicotiana tabacum]
MENQEVSNPREVPPPVQIEDQFDEVAPRPANRILRDYARPDRFNYESSVRKSPVAANNFKIRTGLIQTIQQSCIFTGDARDAKTWLRSLPQGSITTWDQMTQKFLNKYFSPAKTTKLRQDISNFLQTDTESVYQAWEMLKAMLRKCPHHDILEHILLYIFYHGLKPSSRNVIDAAAGGSVMGKTTEEALQLLNEISENVIQWPSECIIIKKAATVNQVDALNTLTHQIVSLSQKFETFQVNTQQPSQFEACDMCGGNHQNHECQATNHNDEHVNVIGYKQYPFGSPMAQKHPRFQWSNPNGAENSQSFQKQQIQGPPGYQNPNHGQSNFRPYQQAGPYQQRPQQAHSSLDDLLYKYIKVTDEKMESQNSSLKNLEIQLSQLAALVSEKIQGPLPSNTEKNPKEHLKVITLRSGKELDEPYADQSEQPVNNNEFKDDQLIPDSMERCLIKSGTTQDDDPIIRREAQKLDKDSEEEEMKSEKNKKIV